MPIPLILDGITAYLLSGASIVLDPELDELYYN